MRKYLILSAFALCFLPRFVSALPSTDVQVSGNLDSGSSTFSPGSIPAPAVGNTTTFSALSATSQFETSFNIADSLSASHTIFIYFFHTASLTFDAKIYADGGDIAGGTAGAALNIGDATVVFDSMGDRTQVPGPGVGDITTTPIWSNGSASLGIKFTFAPFTSLASASNISSVDASSGTGCETFSACVAEQFPTVIGNCATNATQCSLSTTDFKLVPSDLADSAISAAGCTGRTFRKRSQCRTCYEHARQKIRKANRGRLFGRFLDQAITEVQSRRDSACR